MYMVGVVTSSHAATIYFVGSVYQSSQSFCHLFQFQFNYIVSPEHIYYNINSVISKCYGIYLCDNGKLYITFTHLDWFNLNLSVK